MIRACFVLWMLLPLFSLVMVEEIQPQARVTKHVLFVVDRSGSMKGDSLSLAYDRVRELSEQPIDEMQFGVIAFNDTHTRWPGIPEGEGRRAVPSGWAAASAEASEAAIAWLVNEGAGGNTLVTAPLEAALLDRRPDLTVVLVSDGLFGYERNEDIVRMINACQIQRERNGFGRAVIVCIGIGAKQQSLVDIAEAGLGGYYRYYDDSPPKGLDGIFMPIPAPPPDPPPLPPAPRIEPY